MDHKDDGLAMVVMDYKELRKDRPPHLIMRERSTGATYGLRCARKGAGDAWVVQRVVDKLESWSLKQFCLWIKSDGEPAMKNLQQAIRAARTQGTHLLNSPPHDPQGNGVAERAVKEYMGGGAAQNQARVGVQDWITN